MNASRIPGKLKEYAKLIRLHALGTSVTAVIGALSVKGGNLEISSAIPLFLIGMLLNIFGFVHNDYKDIKVDKLSKELNARPLVKGTISTRSALVIIILSLLMMFLTSLIFFRGILTMSILFLTIFSGTLYNIFSKKLPGSDVFLSSTMALFCLFGALAVSDSNHGLQELDVLTWVIVIIVFVHVLIMNIMEGGLKDAENDRKAGAKTLAVYLGVKTDKKMYVPSSFKTVIIFFKIITVVLISLPFLFYKLNFSILQIILMIAFTMWMLFSTIKLLNIKTFDRKKIGFHVRNHELASYGLVPIMLMEFIGLSWTLFLILFPFIWFVICNYVLFGKIVSNPKTF